MYATRHAAEHPDQACFVMADSGETVTFREFEERSNRLAHLLRSEGLRPLDHYSIFMGNNSRYLECCGAGERSGLYYTCINSHLTSSELAYILVNSESQLLITSEMLLPVAREVLAAAPNVTLCLVVSSGTGLGAGGTARIRDFETSVSDLPASAIADERLGAAMLYSSGTTGRPKGILRALTDVSPEEGLPVTQFTTRLFLYRERMTYLCPAPLYHSAPLAAVRNAVRIGGTSIIMERFDPERYLALVERYSITHSQLVPTMFSLMLKLPNTARTSYDLSSLEVIVHGAAPCPPVVKQQMIDWWGPIVYEYYGSTEAIGFTFCDSAEAVAHPGTVGRVVTGELHVLDDEMQPCQTGTAGTLWFKTETPLNYFNDLAKSLEVSTPDRSMSTVGDVGYVTEDGYVYLTDRKTFMIISGGVNVYPQETENLLITHPKVADAAVFGIPNVDLGEEVKAVVQPMPDVEVGPELEAELIAFCRANLSREKVPRSIDFDPELPRLPTGKLYKRVLRDKYWPNKANRI